MEKQKKNFEYEYNGLESWRIMKDMEENIIMLSVTSVKWSASILGINLNPNSTGWKQLQKRKNTEIR